MLERLQKIISAAGITSRRAAEELIAEGRVRVNGQVVTEPGSKADPAKDHIKVDGKLINPHQPPTYIMLNKPAGYVTTMSDPEGRPTVQDLLKGVKTRVYPVGRLDYNTEGLLLLTNDGDFAHLITHPRHEFPKTYQAKVKGVLEESQIEKLENGIFLEDGKTAPARVRKMRKEEANSWLEITIHEGRKRQVRRMFDHVGHSVIRLKRTKTGSLVLGDLPEGSFRHLTPEEVRGLRDTALKTDEGGRQIRVFKPEVREEKPRDARAHPVQAIDEEARKRSRARVEMAETRSGMRKNQGLRKPADRPFAPADRMNDNRDAGPRRAGRGYEARGPEMRPLKAGERRTTAPSFKPRPDRAAVRPEWKQEGTRKPGFGNRRAGQRGFQEGRPGPRSAKTSGFGRQEHARESASSSDRSLAARGTGRPAGRSEWKQEGTRKPGFGSRRPGQGGFQEGRGSRPAHAPASGIRERAGDFSSRQDRRSAPGGTGRPAGGSDWKKGPRKSGFGNRRQGAGYQEQRSGGSARPGKGGFSRTSRPGGAKPGMRSGSGRPGGRGRGR